MEERPLHCVWVLRQDFCLTKEEMLKPHPSGHCLFYTTIFGKSNSASGHLKHVWGHSILLIKISQRHSLKHLQYVIVDGRKKPFPWRKKAVSKVIKIPLLSSTTKCRCLHISEDSLKQLLDKQRKLSCLVFSSMKLQIHISEEVQSICVVGLPVRKQKTLSSCAVLTLEFAQLLKSLR